jgi:hypothetical protein
MALKLKQFKVKEKPVFCDLCGKQGAYNHLTVRLYDTQHRYKYSHRPFLTNHKIRACNVCFNKAVKLIENAISF